MAARHTPPGELPEHGTLSRYRYHKCRCDDCRHANTIAKRIERTGDETRGLRNAVHGSRSKYVRGCRCGLCKNANRMYQKEKMAERRALGLVKDARKSHKKKEPSSDTE